MDHPRIVTRRHAGTVRNAANAPYATRAAVQVQRLGQAHLAGKAQLNATAAAGAARSSARALQDAEFDTRGRDTEEAVQREDGGAEGVDGYVAGGGVGGGGDDARAREAHVHVGLGEGGEEREREEEVGHAAGAVGREGVLDDVVRGGARAGDGAGDEARVIGDGGAGVGDLHGRAVGDGFEEAEKGDLVWGEARGGGRGGADAGDVDGAAGQGGEDEAVGEGFVAGEPQKLGIWCRHVVGGLVCDLWETSHVLDEVVRSAKWNRRFRLASRENNKSVTGSFRKYGS